MNYYFVVDKDLSSVNYNCYQQLDVACLVMLEHLSTKRELLRKHGVASLDYGSVHVEHTVHINGSNVTVERYLFDNEIIKESTGNFAEEILRSSYYQRIRLLSKRLVDDVLSLPTVTSIQCSRQSRQQQQQQHKPVAVQLKDSLQQISSSLASLKPIEVKQSILSEPDTDLEELEETIKQLQNAAKHEQEQLNKLKETTSKEKDHLEKYNDRVRDEQRELQWLKDREDERERIFRSDLSVYKLFMNKVNREIADVSKPPPMFIEKYPIFKFLDEKGLLNSEDLYPVYLMIFNGIYEQPTDSDYNSDDVLVPFKINYLDSSRIAELQTTYSQYLPIVSEFCTNVKEKSRKQMKSSDDILRELESENEVFEMSTSTTDSNTDSDTIDESDESDDLEDVEELEYDTDDSNYKKKQVEDLAKLLSN